MPAFARTDDSLLARWWWTTDKLVLGPVLLIIGIGVLLNFTATPSYAERIGVTDNYHFIKNMVFFVPMALGAIFFLSFQNPRMIRRIALLIFLSAFVLAFFTLFVADETKGAKRWISLFGQSIQPSEFLKPTFAILSAWFIASGKKAGNHKGTLASCILLALIASVLLSQPDMGMTFVIGAVWFVQFILSGVGLLPIGMLAVLGLLLVILFYFTFPHFQFRIDSYLNPEFGDSYQINKALEAFHSGGFFGKGPGEGIVKAQIPDAHTDFILAVVGEEFGLITCMIIVLLFAIVIFRGFFLALREKNLFFFLAIVGLVFLFGMQAIVNMLSTLHLMPTKGMTLPFISYGGSSLLSSSIGIGFLLALTRKGNTNGETE